MEALDELAKRDVKALVVACNTSTAVALRDLRARYDLPVLGVVRPGAAAAALATRNRRVGVIATPATVRSHAYFNAIKDENPAVEVYEHATPRFVPMVEAGILAGPELEAVVAEELAPAARRARRGGRVRLPATALGEDRHAPAGLHPLPAPAPDPRARRRRPGGDRGLGDGHGRDPGGAAVRQRPRGPGHHPRHGGRSGRCRPLAAGRALRAAAGARAAHHGRRGALPLDRVADVRRGVPGRRADRARGPSADARRRAPGARRAAGSPRSACGRSGSSSARCWARP